MNEKLISLLTEVGKNEKLRNELNGKSSIEDVYAVTTKYVDGYTIDELKEGLKQVKEMLDKENQADGELSDNDLEAVAGGSKSGIAIAARNTTWGDVGGSLVSVLSLGIG